MHKPNPILKSIVKAIVIHLILNKKTFNHSSSGVLNAMIGVKKMLALIWHRETSIKGIH